MASSSFNDISHDTLRGMDESQAESLIQDLLYAELRRLNISPESIKASTIPKAKDGGIDVAIEIREKDFASAREIIPHPITYYQIKSGEQKLGSKDVKKLFSDKDIILPRIKNCLDRGGHLVFCLFANDPCDQKKEGEILERFYSALKTLYGNRCEGRIHLWQTGSLIRYFRYVPALVLRINNRSSWPLWHHREWVDRTAEMKNTLIHEETREAALKGVQEALLKDSTSLRQFRILGEPGIGKTRFACEALKHEALSQDVLYAPTPSAILGNPEVERSIRDVGKGTNLTLVVDECPYDEANKLSEIFQNVDYPLNLITINNETEGVFRQNDPARIELIRLPNSSITEILSGYGMPESISANILDLCEGSPR